MCLSPLALLDHPSIGRLEFETATGHEILVKIFDGDGIEAGVCRGCDFDVVFEEEVEGLGCEEVVVGVGVLNLVG